MVWLIAFLVSHAAEIAVIGATAAAIAQTEQVVINTTTIVRTLDEVNK